MLSFEIKSDGGVEIRGDDESLEDLASHVLEARVHGSSRHRFWATDDRTVSQSALLVVCEDC